MLDRVISIEPGRGGTGLKAVSAADCPVPEGSPTDPALPGPIALHGLCTLAEMVLTEAGKRHPILEAVEEATFLKTARPGQVLNYSVTVVEASRDAAVIQAEATLQGETAVRARLKYRLDGVADDPLASGWRGLLRGVLSGEPPTILR